MAIERGGRKRRPRRVWKTEVFRAIDRLSRDRAAVERALEDLRRGGPMVEVGARNRLIEGGDERMRHLAEHWLGDEQAGRVLRRGLIRAAELALERDLPIDAYWVFAGSSLEVAVSANDRQITLLVVTPFPDVPTEGEEPAQPGIELFR